MSPKPFILFAARVAAVAMFPIAVTAFVIAMIGP